MLSKAILMFQGQFLFYCAIFVEHIEAIKSAFDSNFDT